MRYLIILASFYAGLVITLVGCDLFGVAAKAGTEAVSHGLSAIEQGGIWAGAAAFLATFGKSFMRIYAERQLAKANVPIPKLP